MSTVIAYPVRNNPPASAQAKEFAWTEADFKRVQGLIFKRAGISLHDSKHAMVYSRLSRRLRENGFGSFVQYLDWLERHDGEEWQEFVNALTTNLTAFFRESHHFDVLAKRLQETAVRAPCRVWCCASSTGEEPYSIMMVAREVLGDAADFRLVASDIDSKVLATAQRGVYKLDALKDLGSSRMQRFFLRGKGGNDGYAKVRPELQQGLSFININLMHDNWPFKEPFDMVFCRNVMIYFNAATQRQVLERIHRVLKPGGLLFVGHAENFSESRDLFVLRGKTVYERC